ncbi:hypothetical protein ACSSS7_001497 [Eimeria intestinalis]
MGASPAVLEEESLGSSRGGGEDFSSLFAGVAGAAGNRQPLQQQQQQQQLLLQQQHKNSQTLEALPTAAAAAAAATSLRLPRLLYQGLSLPLDASHLTAVSQHFKPAIHFAPRRENRYPQQPLLLPLLLLLPYRCCRCVAPLAEATTAAVAAAGAAGKACAWEVLGQQARRQQQLDPQLSTGSWLQGNHPTASSSVVPLILSAPRRRGPLSPSDQGLRGPPSPPASPSRAPMDFLAPHVGQRVVLPLATGATRLVSFELEAPVGAPPNLLPEGASQGGPPYLCCWKDEAATEPKFYIPLKGCRMVNNITELGPCLYFVSSTGEFEFQCSSRQACARWVETFKGLGVCLLKFTDLYKLTDFIGEGSFAKVYIGKHLFTGEEVVIKAVDKKKVLESNVYTEIEVLRKVSHPYIMRLYAAYEQEDFVCLVLEYLRGGELFDYLSEKGPFSEDQARHAMRRILLALQAMHMKGIVHRDLKTENLIIEHPSNPASIKIIDFGLAATVGSQEMKMRCGSPGYVAPEILQDLPYGPKVDVFSSGVILYTLLAGFPPFRGQNVKDILRKNLRCQLNFSHQRWAGVPHSVKDLIGWMCCRQPAKRCAAVQALTHPWFQRIARPLCKAAALSTLAAEESDRKATLQHLEHSSHQGQREPLGLRAGGEAPGGEVTEELNERMQGLRLRSKAAEAAKQSCGPSFFNSAPPGAAATSDAPSERETHYKLQTTESQGGGLAESTSKQTAAVKAAVKAVESREAAAQKAAAKAQASAEAKAAAAEVVRALTAARQPLWAAQDQEEEDTAGPRNCPSAAPERVDYACAGGDAAAAVAAAAAAAAADIFGAAAGLARMQQQQQRQEGSCSRAAATHLAHHALGSPVALMASEAPLPAEVSERLSSFDSESPPPAPTEDDRGTPKWGDGSETPTDPSSTTEKPEEAPSLPAAAAAAAAASSVGPPALTAHSSRRHQWLEEPPPSPDSGGSTQASPTAAFRNCQMAELSLALDLECPEHSRASLGDPLADPFDEPLETTAKMPSDEAPKRASKFTPEDAFSPKAIPRACKIAVSAEPRETTSEQRTRSTDPLVAAIGPREAPQTGGLRSPCSPYAQSCAEHDAWGVSCLEQGDEALLDGLPEDVDDTQKQKQQVVLGEPRASAAQGDWKRLKRRATLRPPLHSVEHQEAPCGDRPAVFDNSSDSQESPARQRDEAAVAADTRAEAPSRGASVGGCTQAAVVRPTPPSWPSREDKRGRGRSAFRADDQPQGFPSLVLPAVGKRHEAPNAPGLEGGGPLQSPPALRTVKMQPYKQLHSHHYLVKGANEVIRSGSLPSSKNLVRAPCTSRPPFETSQLGIRSQRSAEERSTRREAPLGSAGGACGWRASGTSCSSYEGSKALSSTTRKGIGAKPIGTCPINPIPEGSPSSLCRDAPLLGACHVAPHERPPSHSSSTSSNRSSSHCNGPSRGGERSCNQSSRQHHQPLHALQSRLLDFMGLPVLSKMASAFGARDWLRHRSRSNAGPIPGSLSVESAEGRPTSKASRVGEEIREGRIARALKRDRGKREVLEEG